MTLKAKCLSLCQDYQFNMEKKNLRIILVSMKTIDSNKLVVKGRIILSILQATLTLIILSIQAMNSLMLIQTLQV